MSSKRTGSSPGKSSSPPSKTPEHSKKAPQPAKKAPQPVKKVQPVKKTSAPVVSKSNFDPKSYAKNGVTQQQVTVCKQSFDLFDSDQGGTVDIKELKAAMTSLGFQSKSNTIFQMLSDLDADGSGTIDFQQWVNLLTKKVNDKDSRANINKIFALYDDERTGFISVKNLRRVAQELGQNVTEQELDELIHRADCDHDGLVSQDQFYTIVTRKIKD